MPNEFLINAIRKSDFPTFKEIVGSLSLEALNAPNAIHYSDWFPGIGFSLLQLVSMVRSDYAQPLIDRGVEMDLHSACALGDISLIEGLLRKDIKGLNKSIAGFYPINYATRNPEVLNLILESGDDPNRDIQYLAWFDWEAKAVEKGYAKYNPIHLIGVGRGGVASAECLSKWGADLKAVSSPFGEAPIHLAAIYDGVELITWLVDKGIEVDTANEMRHVENKVGELFNESYYSPFENSHRKTALMLAAGEGQIAAVRQLIKLKANPNAEDTEGYTPLHYAAGSFWKSNLEIVELLISAGAAVDAKSHTGLSPRDLALKKNYSAIVELLS